MAAKKKSAPRAKAKKVTVYHKNGSVWAKGQQRGDVMVGYWEWFRLGGVIMRSGSFDDGGAQTGEWTTYDKKGKVFKVTVIKPKKVVKTESS